MTAGPGQASARFVAWAIVLCLMAGMVAYAVLTFLRWGAVMFLRD